MKLINKNEDLYDKKENPYGIIESLKDEFKIDFFCNYIDNLILVNDLLEDKVKIYIFKDETLKFYHDFPIDSKYIKGIIKLKNNDFIIYSHSKLEVLKFV